MNDMTPPKAERAAALKGLGSARKQVCHAPRSGHVVPLDYGWNEVVRQIDAFARAGEGT